MEGRTQTNIIKTWSWRDGFMRKSICSANMRTWVWMPSSHVKIWAKLYAWDPKCRGQRQADPDNSLAKKTSFQFSGPHFQISKAKSSAKAAFFLFCTLPHMYHPCTYTHTITTHINAHRHIQIHTQISDCALYYKHWLERNKQMALEMSVWFEV